MGLVDDDGEILLLERLLRQDRLHRIGEGLDRHHDDRHPFEQGIGQLLALRLRALVSIDRRDETGLVVDLLHRVLQLAIEDVAVGHDDGGIENRRAIVLPELDEVVCRPRDGRSLAGSGAMFAQVCLTRSVFLGIRDHFVDSGPLMEARED